MLAAGPPSLTPQHDCRRLHVLCARVALTDLKVVELGQLIAGPFTALE